MNAPSTPATDSASTDSTRASTDARIHTLERSSGALAAPTVLFLDHSSEMGGAELYLLDVARHVPNARVLLFTHGPFEEELRAAGVPVEVAGAADAIMKVSRDGSLLDGLRAIPAVARMLWRMMQAARDADVLYANSQKSFVVAAVASVLTGVPLIWNLHDILSTEHFSPAKIRLVITLANTCADLVVVNSEASRAAFVEAGGDVQKTRIAYNGIDAARFEAVSASDIALVRDELGVDEKTPLVGVFSRLAPWKGQHVLLDALATLPNVHGVFVGEALFQEEQVYAAELREQANRLGLTDRVHFLGFRTDVPRLMRAVDIVAHTSVSAEPFGRVIVEGMLAGKPVVATRAGGALEILSDGETGRFVAPGDAEDLAETLQDLLRRPEHARQSAEAGRAHARETFSVEAMVGQVRAAVEEVTR